MKDFKVITNGTIFSGTRENKRFNLVQEDEHLDIVFSDDGIFRACSNRILITGFQNYEFLIQKRGGKNCIVCDQQNDLIRLHGKKKKNIVLPSIFPRKIPKFNNVKAKSKDWSFDDSIKNRVIEFYRFDSFEGIVIYDYPDPTLVDYETIAKLVGTKLQYIASSVRFNSGHTPIEKIVNNIVGKKARNTLWAYVTDTGDRIIMSPQYETKVFKVISPTETEDESEAMSGVKSPDRTETVVLEALEKVLNVGRSCIQKSETVSCQVSDLTEQIAALETENAEMRARIDKLESIINAMSDALTGSDADKKPRSKSGNSGSRIKKIQEIIIESLEPKGWISEAALIDTCMSMGVSKMAISRAKNALCRSFRINSIELKKKIFFYDPTMITESDVKNAVLDSLNEQRRSVITDIPIIGDTINI